jgi:hypothetical protein
MCVLHNIFGTVVWQGPAIGQPGRSIVSMGAAMFHVDDTDLWPINIF